MLCVLLTPSLRNKKAKVSPQVLDIGEYQVEMREKQEAVSTFYTSITKQQVNKNTSTANKGMPYIFGKVKLLYKISKICV